jgi:hypothetical protein
VKLARFGKPKASCFLSYVENRSKTNTSNIMKNRSHLGARSLAGEGGYKKEVKGNGILSIQE